MKDSYFVAWVAQTETEYSGMSYGSHYIESRYKGNKLLDAILEIVHKDKPGAIITSITKLS